MTAASLDDLSDIAVARPVSLRDIVRRNSFSRCTSSMTSIAPSAVCHCRTVAGVTDTITASPSSG